MTRKTHNLHNFKIDADGRIAMHNGIMDTTIVATPVGAITLKFDVYPIAGWDGDAPMWRKKWSNGWGTTNLNEAERTLSATVVKGDRYCKWEFCGPVPGTFANSRKEMTAVGNIMGYCYDFAVDWFKNLAEKAKKRTK